MIEVKVRWENEADSRHLTKVPANEIDTVIPLLASWGVVDQSTDEFFGQFIVPRDTQLGDAYYEVVIPE